MAIAKIDHSTPCVDLTRLLALPPKGVSKIVELNVEEDVFVQAPAPKETAPADDTKDPSGLTLADKLAFIQMLEKLIAVLSKFKLTTNQTQSEFNKVLIKSADDTAAKAKKQYDDYIAAKEAADHQGFFAKIFSYIASALTVVIGFVIGGPVGGMAALAVCSLMLSDAGKKLDDALSKAGIPEGWCITIKVGICAAMTGGFCALESVSVRLTASALEEGVAGAAAKAVDGAAVESTPDKVFTLTKTLNYSSQAMTVFNPLGNILSVIMKSAGMDKDKADMLGNLIGQVINILTSLAAAYTGLQSAASSGTSKLQTMLGAKAFDNLNKGLTALRVGASSTQSIFQIQEGNILHNQGSIEKEMGATKQKQIGYEAAINTLQQAIQSFERTFASEINGCYMNFGFMTRPDQILAEILG